MLLVLKLIIPKLLVPKLLVPKLLVPKLRLGTQKQQALACFIREARASKAGFPSRAWEPGARTGTSSGNQYIETSSMKISKVLRKIL
jgi:hypothetical protein